MNLTTTKPIYPENAYCAIFDATKYPDLPQDAEETLDYVLETLTPREADVFKLNYKYEWVYRDIGEKHGVTSERVRQIHARALRKLRHPSRSNILLIGRETYLTEIVAANEETKSKYNKRIASLERLIQQQEAEIASRLGEVAELEKQADPAHDILKTSVSELDLSVRSRNGLIRAGIHTVKEILDYGYLLRIRSLGVQSVNEIEDKVTVLMKAAGCTYVSLQPRFPVSGENSQPCFLTATGAGQFE